MACTNRFTPQCRLRDARLAAGARVVVRARACNSCVSYSPCVGCGTCSTCSPWVGCSSCASYSPCVSYVPSVGCGACGGGCCGAMSYCRAGSGLRVVRRAGGRRAGDHCARDAGACGDSASGTAPATIAPSLPGPAPQGAAPPPTFEKTERPATEPELKPIPRPDTQLNSMPAPLLSDPRDRTTARPNHATGAIHLVAAAAATRPSEDNDGGCGETDANRTHRSSGDPCGPPATLPVGRPCFSASFVDCQANTAPERNSRELTLPGGKNRKSTHIPAAR